MHSSHSASLTVAIAGLMVAILGITSGPLIVVTGIMMTIYGALNMHRLAFGNAAARLQSTRVAATCQRANHSNCQDDPGCTCACHAERIEIKVTY